MAIRSMTAFASGERPTVWGTLSCDIRAVNHRFFELGLRLPDELRPIEAYAARAHRAQAARGKIDVTLRCRPPEGGQSELHPNASLLARLSELALDLDARFPRMHTDFIEVLQFPGVLERGPSSTRPVCRPRDCNCSMRRWPSSSLRANAKAKSSWRACASGSTRSPRSSPDP